MWDLVVYFYADDGILILTQPERLQRDFDVLEDLFNRVSLRKNTRKMASMACKTFYMPGSMSVMVYERQTTGLGTTY